jgi:hydrogenase nickel incorporation protein HypB
VNPDIEVIRISATTGEGMDEWLAWIAARMQPAATQSKSQPASRPVLAS